MSIKVPDILSNIVAGVQEHLSDTSTGCHTPEQHKELSNTIMQDVMRAINECSDVGSPIPTTDMLVGVHVAMTVFLKTLSGADFLTQALIEPIVGPAVLATQVAIHGMATGNISIDDADFENILGAMGVDTSRSADEVIANLEAEQNKNDKPGYL